MIGPFIEDVDISLGSLCGTCVDTDLASLGNHIEDDSIDNLPSLFGPSHRFRNLQG